VATPSKSLDGDKKAELTFGSVLTHGTPHGEKMVSSELEKEIQVLTLLSLAAPQISLFTPKKKNSSPQSSDEINLDNILNLYSNLLFDLSISIS
jgi:hypothetical protein